MALSLLFRRPPQEIDAMGYVDSLLALIANADAETERMKWDLKLRGIDPDR